MQIQQQNTRPRDWKDTGATFLMLAAGIIHFIIIPHHWEHAPAHGIALGVFGALEVAWAVIYSPITILLKERSTQWKICAQPPSSLSMHQMRKQPTFKR